jgi:hypothetical protein
MARGNLALDRDHPHVEPGAMIPRVWRVVLVVALLLLAWTVVYGQAPPVMLSPGPTPDPPIPDDNRHPMCVVEKPCVTISMRINRVPRYFTDADLGMPRNKIDTLAWCEGHLSTAGTMRYFADGRAPSAVIGTLVPPVPNTPPQSTDPQGTLEEGSAIVLYNRDLVLGFKAVAATGSFIELAWTCQL